MMMFIFTALVLYLLVIFYASSAEIRVLVEDVFKK